ncbi:hypothetical protein TVAG_247090 [Trichomonas vaginalis G3]|uniref:Kinetochore protein SPC25 n=1 Tax=Trichomonas vaginalis (strain ATCC PRA-98 / G3) TaxID=412133 RepID=A2DKP7_TRIV3|nr:hypothetical protein TVAGG3_0560820 [Trichomonas vaginalis G3]EAY19030.1 hypothetical protein TVAG_247090 [Trichomonas vaginalis G3]KAI5521176.1 hypothetical protein TVAGG3_0560820 [Trichomonas vaginalis G3]|eukprot:XP_001580016.1 hypothetical protein [Trichomonas vaginalis G3]
MTESDESFWKERYIQIEKCYKDLVRIRKNDVREDIEVYRERLAEAQQMHKISVEEIQRQINDINTDINAMEGTINQMDKSISHIRDLKRELSRKSKVLECVFSVPGIQLTGVTNDFFQFSVGNNYEFTFSISKGIPFEYKPISYTEDFSVPSWTSQPRQFKDLNEMRNYLEQLIPPE